VEQAALVVIPERLPGVAVHPSGEWRSLTEPADHVVLLAGWYEPEAAFTVLR
jgi:hypothetical protein